MIWVESTPRPGTSASRSTASWCWLNRLAISWSSWPICSSINYNSLNIIFSTPAAAGPVFQKCFELCLGDGGDVLKSVRS